MEEMEKRFHAEMVEIYVSAKDECHYNATRFLQMVSEKGGVATARTLLATSSPSQGFTALWECGRLDLTVEANVLKPEFATLFSDEERNVARHRLEKYGYRFG